MQDTGSGNDTLYRAALASLISRARGQQQKLADADSNVGSEQPQRPNAKLKRRRHDQAKIRGTQSKRGFHVPIELVDRARMDLLVNKDSRIFVRGLLLDARLDVDHVPPPKGAVELFIADKLRMIQAQSAHRRNKQREDQGEFNRASDGLQLLGEILAERKGVETFVSHNSSPRSPGPRMMPSEGMLQLIRSEAALADAERILHNYSVT